MMESTLKFLEGLEALGRLGVKDYAPENAESLAARHVAALWPHVARITGELSPAIDLLKDVRNLFEIEDENGKVYDNLLDVAARAQESHDPSESFRAWLLGRGPGGSQGVYRLAMSMNCRPRPEKPEDRIDNTAWLKLLTKRLLDQAASLAAPRQDRILSVESVGVVSDPPYRQGGNRAAATSPSGEAPPINPENWWEEHKDRQILISWKAILKALDAGPETVARNQVKRCQDSFGGPIAWLGHKPRVDRGELRAWWAGLHRRQEQARAQHAHAKTPLEHHSVRESESMHVEQRPNAKGKARPAPNS